MSNQSFQIRWQAVQTRDSSMDNVFVYAVRSTGIYCQPSCPSRRPNLENVAFFDTPEQAEAAGFRRCKRCWTRAEKDVTAKIVQKVIDLLENEVDEPSLEALGAAVNLSSWHLQRVFKKAVGISPKQYAKTHRAKKLRGELKTNDSVTRALFEAGFGSSSRMYESQNAQLGMNPKKYRAGGKGERIAYVQMDSPVGRMLLAATARGLVAVRFGEDVESLAELKSEFPNATLEPDPDLLAPQTHAILEHILGHTQELNLPIDVQATVFQTRVWNALKSIPYGETRSYAEVAQAIQQPTAVRAVAQACATNPIALVVPCHRVIAANGDLNGYRWGIDRKRKLLELEASAAD
jgi:AraC family transcriptional regulator, regulatory protein of adaptative response / methylated-DNA-[protein]-cysteine methyltransferase